MKLASTVISVIALGALTSSNAAASGATQPQPVPQAITTKYVQVVIFENKSYRNILGNPQAPYMTSLAKTWANLTRSFAVAHPSQPNYFALFSGSTQGVVSDHCPETFNAASNLGSELIAAGISFTGYAESMPSDGFMGCRAARDHLPSRYLYARKHVPWADFTNVPNSDSKVYPGALTQPPARMTWITPNMCNDMHDCPIGFGDAWAAKNLPKLIAWDKANHGVLILTFDENDYRPGNQIPTILAGNVNPGQYSQRIDHYSVLRTIENIFGVPPIGKSATATPITGVIK